MPLDPGQAIEEIERSLGLAPAALLAIVMLAGPTLAWLLYRFVVQPRTSRYSAQDRDLLWVCEDCRSANDLRSRLCYACGLDRDEMAGAVQVVDDTEVVTLREDGVPVIPAVAADGAPAVAAASTDRASAGRATGSADRPLVPVGPGRSRLDDRPVGGTPVHGISEPTVEAPTVEAPTVEAPVAPPAPEAPPVPEAPPPVRPMPPRRHATAGTRARVADPGED